MGYVAPIFDKRDAYRVLVRKLEGVRLLGRPRRRWECNIKADLDQPPLVWTSLLD